MLFVTQLEIDAMSVTVWCIPLCATTTIPTLSISFILYFPFSALPFFILSTPLPLRLPSPNAGYGRTTAFISALWRQPSERGENVDGEKRVERENGREIAVISPNCHILGWELFLVISLITYFI